jgi:translation elongation factor Ts
MAITATEVKKLRDATGAGMMDAKKALTETDGDFDKAIEVLRISGAAKAAKRAERDATAGLVANYGSAIVELNSETDFVAKNEQFIDLAEELAVLADKVKPADAAAFATETLDNGKTVAEAVADLAIVIGEKIELGRVASFEGNVATYMHRRARSPRTSSPRSARSPRRPPVKRASPSRRSPRSPKDASTGSSRKPCCSTSRPSRTTRRPSRLSSMRPA